MASMRQGAGVEHHLRKAFIADVSTIGLETAKSIQQTCGADATGAVVIFKQLTRGRLRGFFAAQPRCMLAMEPCAGAHHSGRELIKLGHTVKLILPHYVKLFVKRQKSDMADAEAICEAVQRPTMRFVPIKSEEQQAGTVVFRARDLLVCQRTQCVNALRSHAAEYGWTTPKGLPHVLRLIRRVEDSAETLPPEARAILKVLVTTIRSLDEQVAKLDRAIAHRVKADPVVRRLMTIPGTGPIAATAIFPLAPPAESFVGGHHLAAWIRLTRLQKSIGGKRKPSTISKVGARSLPRLLVIGTTAGVKHAVARGTAFGSLLAQMLASKPSMRVIVALADKIARTVWAPTFNADLYRAPAAEA